MTIELDDYGFMLDTEWCYVALSWQLLSVDNKANSADELLNVMTELNKLGKGFTYNVRGVEVK